MTVPAGEPSGSLATDLHVEATNRLVEALVESENRMRRRVEQLADVIIETDAQGRIAFLSRAWETVVGSPTGDVIGEPLTSFFPAEAVEGIDRLVALAPGVTGRMITRVTRGDGGQRWVELSSSGIVGGGTVAVMRDITRQKHDQDELAKLSVVASSTDSLVIITDAQGLIDWVNPAFESRTGYDLFEVQGQKPGSFLQGPATDPLAVSALRAAVEEQQSVEVEILNYTKAGETYWVEVTLTPVFGHDGSLERFISVQTDVSEHRRVERMKSEFVSTVSHELRTPLTAIVGTLGLIAGGVGGELSNDARALITIAQRNSHRLQRLIDDLLDMEKLVAGKVRLDMVVADLMPMVDAAVEETQAFADEFDVHLVVAQRAPGARVDVDPQRFHQVLSNLLSNAAKFSDPGGRVDVRVACDPESVRISVDDTGRGIPEEFQSRIFEKFSQADSSDVRQQGGTGLGLAISRELVERMGGTIGFTSTFNEGSSFFFELPLARDL